MRSPGTVLKEAREKDKRTLAQISRRTRIKEKFLSALENSDWASLPNFTVAQGFARAYAQNVGVDPDLIVALIRRDFPQPEIAKANNEISLHPNSIWTPKATIVGTVILCFALLAIYLGKQYFQFAAPPPLAIGEVYENNGVIEVTGKTQSSATVEVNGRPVLVESDGSFSTEIEKQDLINSQVVVQAISRTGKKSTVSKACCP